MEVVVDDPNERLAYFEQQVGQILDEMEARVAQTKEDGTAYWTNYDFTHLNVTEMELVAGPAESNPQEERGELFLTAIFLLSYVG